MYYAFLNCKFESLELKIESGHILEQELTFYDFLVLSYSRSRQTDSQEKIMFGIYFSSRFRHF